ncbi:MAG: site-specific DNA-methyltransferase [Candidatus Bathyarchaeia archaeon]|jgi:adenine-specific DNA-methyltransferase
MKTQESGRDLTAASINLEQLPEKRKKDSARLVWDTKPKRAPNPKDIEFQTAEIVLPNPNRDQQRISTFFANISKVEINRTKMNRLIWGDNLLTMQALLASGYEGKIDLIYIDPPFWTGENYYYTVKMNGEEVTMSPSVIERLAYKDYWEGGIDSYLDMLYPRLHLMKKLLSQHGSIYLHIDWHVGHYVKIIMDEIFGRDNFVNEIVWQRKGTQAWETDRFGITNDAIFLYSKSDQRVFNPLYSKDDPNTQQYIAERFVFDDGDGRGKYRKSPLVNPLLRRNLIYEFHGVHPPPKGWLYSKERMEEMFKNNELVMPQANSGRIYRKIYLDKYEGQMIQNIWTDIPIVNPMAIERLDFDTQKPEKLLERIISTSSNPGDLVADFFLGSGTTTAVAERLGRRWIGCDFSKTAIQISRNRLVTLDSRPFLLENIGNYQRHMIYLSGGRIFEMQHIVLKLYGAMPRKDFPELGTKKADDGVNELVYVGYPDRAVTAKKTEELAHLAETLDGTGYQRLVILGWDYEYNYEEILATVLRPILRKMRVEISNRTIPPEVYEYLKTHSSTEDIDSLAGKVTFHDKPFLKLSKPKVERSKGQATVSVGIERYILYDLPVEDEKSREEVQEVVKKNFAALLDYWAIDWDYDGFTFKSSWQAFRGFGKAIKEVPLSTAHNLSTGKKYTIAIRAVDIFGNDATATCSADLR